MRGGAALLGGAFCVAMAGGSLASNMVFKLDVEFPCGPTKPYVISLPLLAGVQDRADSSHAGDKCSPPAPDGVIDTYDLLCQLFSDKDAADASGTGMTIQVFDRSNCLFSAVSCFHQSGALSYIGSPTVLSEVAGEGGGFLVQANCGEGQSAPIVNAAALVGAHDETFPGRVTGISCSKDVIAVPYHTLLRTADEILCGLEGIDWDDADDDGWPDTCPGGVYDPVSGAAVTVQWVDLEQNSYVGRTVFNGAGGPSFIGEEFSLVQGDGYQLGWDAGYGPRTFLTPHY